MVSSVREALDGGHCAACDDIDLARPERQEFCTVAIGLFILIPTSPLLQRGYQSIFIANLPLPLHCISIQRVEASSLGLLRGPVKK